MRTSMNNAHNNNNIMMNNQIRKRSRSPSSNTHKRRNRNHHRSRIPSTSTTATWIGITTHLLLWSSSTTDAFTQETRRVLSSTVNPTTRRKSPTGETHLELGAWEYHHDQRTYFSRRSSSSTASTAFSTREAYTSTILNYRDDDSSTDEYQSSSSSPTEPISSSSQRKDPIWKFLVPGTSIQQIHSQRRRQSHDNDPSSSSSSTSAESSQQCVIDEYLESIDKRYKRLHQGEYQSNQNKQSSTQTSPNSKSTGFTSAISWLRNTASTSDSLAEEQRKQEDALFVLGLADLASTQLLQKHQLPSVEFRGMELQHQHSRRKGWKGRRQRLDEGSVVIDVMGTMDDTTTTTNTPPIQTTELIPSSKKTTLHPLTKVFTILQSLRLICSHRFALTCLKVTVQSKDTAKRVVSKVFGGKWAYQMTQALAAMTLAYALMVTRPVLKTFFKA